MCNKACESSDLILCMDRSQQVIVLSQAGILANTTSLVNLAKSYNNSSSESGESGESSQSEAQIPEKMLREYLVDRKHVSNIRDFWFAIIRLSQYANVPSDHRQQHAVHLLLVFYFIY